MWRYSLSNMQLPECRVFRVCLHCLHENIPGRLRPKRNSGLSVLPSVSGPSDGPDSGAGASVCMTIVTVPCIHSGPYIYIYSNDHWHPTSFPFVIWNLRCPIPLLLLRYLRLGVRLNELKLYFRYQLYYCLRQWIEQFALIWRTTVWAQGERIDV